MSSLTSTRDLTRHTVHEIRNLTESTYVLRMDRHGLDFEPGQYISLGVSDDINMREYSVYSPLEAEYLEVLIKEVRHGHVSKLLRRLKPGDDVRLDGPFGFFTIDEEARRSSRFLFIATGTGISPFHCFALSYPGLDYTVLHGVRTAEECYEKEAFDPDRYVSCLTQDANGDYHGRVTDYLRENPPDSNTLCYLCGNCDMIYEAFDILVSHGVPHDQMFAEVYF